MDHQKEVNDGPYYALAAIVGFITTGAMGYSFGWMLLGAVIGFIFAALYVSLLVHKREH